LLEANGLGKDCRGQDHMGLEQIDIHLLQSNSLEPLKTIFALPDALQHSCMIHTEMSYLAGQENNEWTEGRVVITVRAQTKFLLRGLEHVK
jgi:hypothetical protein